MMLILSPVAVLFLPALFVFLDYCLTASTVTEFLVQATERNRNGKEVGR